MTALERCAGWTDYGAQCQWWGTLNEDGHWWCGIHAPSKVKARRRRTNAARALKRARIRKGQ